MQLVFKLLGVICYVLTAISVLLVAILHSDIAAVIIFGLCALAFAIAGHYLFNKSKIDKNVPAQASKPAVSSVKSPVPVAPTQPYQTLPAVPDSPVEPAESYKFYNSRVAGVYYRQKPILDELMTRNPDYGLNKSEMIEEGYVEVNVYKYDTLFADAVLVPEPENPHDPNAIKVVVDDVHVGYIPATQTKSVKKIMDNKEIVSITCQIYGGDYKYLSDEDSSLERCSSDLRASLSIKYKP